ncbi:MAG: hypothetical protein ACE5GE_10790 [Phycisphaerae bacterium]
MPLSSLRVRDVPNRWDSLSLALHAVLAWAGLDRHYRAYSAALGHSFMTTATTGPKDCPAWWSTHGRDALLIEAANLFGMRLRPVHPPDAAVGLGESREFAQHFEASYLPIVLRALEHRQPVLAWQGWPEPRHRLWGVITQTAHEGVSLAGTTMWSKSHIVTLQSPPVQLYVVEEVQPRRLDHPTLMRACVTAGVKALTGDLKVSKDVVMGDKAYALWIDRLDGEDRCTGCGRRLADCHRQMARYVTYARQSAVRFFEHYRDGLEAELGALLTDAANHCHKVIEALTAACDAARVESMFATGDGKRQLMQDIESARSADSDLARLMTQIKQALEPTSA